MFVHRIKSKNGLTMKTAIIYVILCFLLSARILAQSSEYFIPKDIQRTYNEKVRTTDGMPGAKYWQNKTKYQIKAEIDPSTGFITGEEKMMYINNSPDYIRILQLKLYPNLFQKGTIRKREVDSLDVNDGMTILSAKVGKEVISIQNLSKFGITGTNMTISTNLKSGDSVEIFLKWKFRLPQNTTIRIGKYDSATYFVGYWYPQIAVYDAVSGFDILPYDGLHEFYQEFADYDVKIEAPENFVIWAGGTLLNAAETLHPDLVKLYSKALISDDKVKIISEDDIENKKQLTVRKNKILWHFEAKNVVDFAYGISNRYCWDAASMPGTDKNRILVQSAYSVHAKGFKGVLGLIKESLDFLSTEMPAIDYPYPQMTVFQGGDGMEFPMMVNQGDAYSANDLVFVTSHEIAHTYFPFLMGINQQTYSWMDEGWAMLLPLKYQQKKSGENKINESSQVFSWYSGTVRQMPLMVPSHYITDYDYYVSSYYHSELAYYFLMDILGESMFKKCLKEYILRWKGKHPLPYDFFFTFENVSGQDLLWFFKPWFFDFAYPDLAIENVKENGTKYEFFIRNNGGLPLPVDFKIVFADQSTQEFHESALIWKNKGQIISIQKEFSKKIKSVYLGNDHIPDKELPNNQFIF